MMIVFETFAHSWKFLVCCFPQRFDSEIRLRLISNHRRIFCLIHVSTVLSSQLATIFVDELFQRGICYENESSVECILGLEVQTELACSFQPELKRCLRSRRQLCRICGLEISLTNG